jgi:hypothetical protein
MIPREPDNLLAQAARGVLEREETRAEVGCHSHTLSIRVPLTAAEWASLRENAAYLKTSVGSLIGWIVSEDIRRGRPSESRS